MVRVLSVLLVLPLLHEPFFRETPVEDKAIYTETIKAILMYTVLFY